MRLSLIGMSGSGKSIWSLKLSGFGFKRLCCDDLISKKLSSELTRPDGTTLKLGEWMGLPYEPLYKKRESEYLACEVEVLTEILDDLERRGDDNEENIVIDTTGSAIYTGQETLKRLRQHTTVVHMATPAEIQEEMLKAYLAAQRPVLWMDLFEKKPGESDEAALARCYPTLLSYRERLYEQIADVTIDRDSLNQYGFGVSDFLNRVDFKNKLHGRMELKK